MPDTSPSRPAAGATRTPALPSTADTVPYVPVSWLAVGAFGLAALYVLVVLAAGYGAWSERRPLLIDWALILPVAAVVLAFAARRVIRNAEGTRTGTLFGVDLPAAAWWTAVVGGLGYAAYFVAIDYSISRDAKGEVVRFADAAVKGEVARAFHRTRDPGERASIPADDLAALDTRYRAELLYFRQCDLARVVGRNPGACEFVPVGMRAWQVNQNGGIECVYRGVVRSPEGTFPVNVPLRGAEVAVGDAPAGRQWQIYLPPGGYVNQPEVRLTPYGWYVLGVEKQGGEFARQFLRDARVRVARPYAYANYARVGDDPFFRPLSVGGETARAAVAGVGLMVATPPPPAYFAETARRLFRLPGGAEPPADKAATFAAAWNAGGVEPAGMRPKESQDTNDMTTIADDAVEVRVPVEIPLPAPPGRPETSVARARLVVACTDPAALAELKRLRSSADPVNGATPTPTIERPPPFAWKLVRVESDLRPVTIRQPTGPGAPGNQEFLTEPAEGP